MNRNTRQVIAAETVAILDRGFYLAPSGRTVSIADELARAVGETRLYPPGEPGTTGAAESGTTGTGKVAAEPDQPSGQRTRVEVTGETTLAAAQRLTDSADDEVCCLNFASAKNPGGGFRSGARAQEESLARASGLYACLQTTPHYYDFHRRQGDPRYSDHMIYSPAVPVFRDDSGTLRERPFTAAFITAPAPNAGAVRGPKQAKAIPAILRGRSAKILAVARHHRHRRLVLGAWGCGVFRNDPARVAAAFREHLDGPFAGSFAQVVFAVLDTAPGRPTYQAFARTFPG